jgi:hypothetical protein
MRIRFAAVAFGALAAACAYAQTNVYQIDWGLGNPADGTAQVLITPQLEDLTNTDANITFEGQVWGTRPGIFQVDVKNDYDSNYHLTDVLCVELTQGTGNAVYGYKDVAGYIGYLADQIPQVVANDNSQHDLSAALALATWKIDYDAYDPTTDSVNLTGLSFSTGLVQYVRTNETLAEYNTILADANGFLADVEALTPAEAQTYAYRYYASPSSDIGEGDQDYITAAAVPSPVAAIPFLAGIILAIRRRK